MARTYLSQLVALVYAVCKYITKHQVVIRSQLADGSLTAFDALVVACNAFMASDIPNQAKTD